ncbi:hypothetical protein Tco_1174445 [Tanacetum coccineum]
MTARILENYNQWLILEFSLDMHRAEKVTKSTTNEPDKSWKIYSRSNSMKLTEQRVSIQSSPGPAPDCMLMLGPIKFRLVPNPDPAIPYVHQCLFLLISDGSIGKVIISSPWITIPLRYNHSYCRCEQYAEVNPFAAADHEPFVNVFAPDPNL